MRKVAAILAVLIVAGAGWQVVRPYRSFGSPVVVSYHRGMSIATFATILEREGVVSESEWLLAARAVRFRRVLQAGEYRFDRAASPLEIIDRLVRGDVLTYEVVVPEGSNAFDVARIFEKAGFGPAEDFLRLAKPREGFLFPATYRFARGTTPERIIDAMESRFEQAWTSLNPGQADKKRIVALASLVEKEAVVPEERPTIAAVFRNRLARGMSLDCDPTVVYAAMLEGKYRGTIYLSDLKREHPYNTYLVKGLPPGPIANPGLDSLKAALRPARTDYLFFVAKPDGSGRHSFSATIGEHNKAVAEFRKGQRRDDAQKRDQARPAGRGDRRTRAAAD